MFKTFTTNTTSYCSHRTELTRKLCKTLIMLLGKRNFQVPRLEKKSWHVSLSAHPSSRWSGVPPLISATLYSGHVDLVEVRLRQLSYHIGPTPVSSGPSSALLAPDGTKNAGIISFFEPPSASTLTKGLLLILEHLFASSRPCPPHTDTHRPITPVPFTPHIHSSKAKLGLPRRSEPELYKVDWKHPCPFPNFVRWRIVVQLYWTEEQHWPHTYTALSKEIPDSRCKGNIQTLLHFVISTIHSCSGHFNS